MDQLGNYGLAGAVLLVTFSGASVGFVWLWRLLNAQIAAREADLLWCRTELDHKRGEYLAALKEQASQYTSSLDRTEKVFREAISEICQRLEKIEEDLKHLQNEVTSQTNEIDNL